MHNLKLINRSVLSIHYIKLAPKIGGKNTYCAHLFCSSVFCQVADAMKRMHERLNIGKVILLPEAKKEEEKPKSETEKPKSDPEPVQSAEKPEGATNEKKEETTEEVKAED